MNRYSPRVYQVCTSSIHLGISHTVTIIPKIHICKVYNIIYIKHVLKYNNRAQIKVRERPINIYLSVTFSVSL